MKISEESKISQKIIFEIVKSKEIISKEWVKWLINLATAKHVRKWKLNEKKIEVSTISFLKRLKLKPENQRNGWCDQLTLAKAIKHERKWKLSKKRRESFLIWKNES